MTTSVTSINGTGPDETLNGTARDDIISTTFTNPSIYAGEGNDSVSAAVNSDTQSTIYIEGGAGNDTLGLAQLQVSTTILMPMPGFDPLNPFGPPPFMPMPVPAKTPSNATIAGGAGEDTIAVKSFLYGTLNISAGEDNDTVYMSGVTTAATVDLGAGDDTVTLTGATASTITSGSGSDTIVLDSWGLTPSQTPVVSDFTAGTGGDILDFGQIITYLEADGGLGADADPYENGYITAEQSGDDVVFYLDADGAGTTYAATKLITLSGVTLTDLSTANFADGFGDFTVGNSAPEVGTEISDIQGTEDTAINVALGKGIFTDADSDTLKLRLTLSDGEAAPAWLSYNAATHAIEGTPPANFTGTISLKLTASDAVVSASQTFDLIISNVNDAPTGGVTISGDAAEDATLTAVTTDLKDADGLGTLSYAWLRDGVAITGATASSYTLGDADVGKSIKVQVSYTDGHKTAEVVTSAATAAVTNVNDVPAGGVTITGDATQGATLKAVTSALTDADGIKSELQYQWLRNGQAISGATGASYTLGLVDSGQTIQLSVAYTDGHGKRETVTSAATAAVTHVNTAPAGEVSIIGDAIATGASEGSVLTAFAGTLSDADGLGSLSYVWLRNGVVISGATESTYTVTKADQLATITIQASYVDGFGTPEAVTSTGIAVPEFVVIPDPVITPPEGPHNYQLTTGNDSLFAGSGNDTIVAGRGSDTVIAGTGSDSVIGGLGNDLVVGGQGADTIIGNRGNDVLRGGSGSDVVVGGVGNDSVIGGGGDDVVRGGFGSDIVIGRAGNDILKGGAGNDILIGGQQDDQLYSGEGDDFVFGNQGDDVIHGGRGSDTLYGGAGDDTLTGGEGADLFVFTRLGAGEETVSDFAAEDMLYFVGTWTTAGYASEEAFLRTYAETVNDGVLITLERGNSVFLEGVEDISDLAGHISFYLQADVG